MRRIEPLLFCLLLFAALLACKRKPPGDEATSATPELPAPPPPAPPAPPELERPSEPAEPAAPTPPAKPRPPGTPAAKPTPGASASAPAGAVSAPGTASAPAATGSPPKGPTREECLKSCSDLETRLLTQCIGPLAGELCEKNAKAAAEQCRNFTCPKQ